MTSSLEKRRQDHADRLLADAFRLLGQVCTKMAEWVDSQRLSRAGISELGKFLSRVDEGKSAPNRDG